MGPARKWEEMMMQKAMGMIAGCWIPASRHPARGFCAWNSAIDAGQGPDGR
jgi:hypothetical protein